MKMRVEMDEKEIKQACTEWVARQSPGGIAADVEIKVAIRYGQGDSVAGHIVSAIVEVRPTADANRR